jgi:predicted enzyme related to lactoylglutathione lyase
MNRHISGLCQSPFGGTLVYLDAGADLTDHLGRVEPAGGKIIEPIDSLRIPAEWYFFFFCPSFFALWGEKMKDKEREIRGTI